MCISVRLDIRFMPPCISKLNQDNIIQTNEDIRYIITKKIVSNYEVSFKNSKKKIKYSDWLL